MNNPESLSRLNVFRALGGYLRDHWGLGLQIVQPNVPPRPVVVSTDSALSVFLSAALPKASLRAAHQEAMTTISDANDVEIHEHPAGFQLLTVPIRQNQILGQLTVGPFSVLEEIKERRESLKNYLSKGGVPAHEARNVSGSLQGIERRDLTHVAALAEILAKEAAQWMLEQRESERRLDRLRKKDRARYHAIVGKSIAMMHLFQTLDRIVESDSTVYIYGENGTGKELVAKEIHNNSRRANAPFLVQNCAALNDNLLESEIFGHKRGAFTGAVQDKPGLFEMADGGTFFLDEVGDMSTALQVKLLRFLQEGTFLPVGDVTFRKVDVRIVCATNRDLEQMVADGTFRQDLYFRLNVINLRVPPLRERREDIPLLVEYFLARAAETPGGTGNRKRLAKAAMTRLMAYHWPGNVRELENEIERMLVLAGTLVTTMDESLLSPRVQHQPLTLDSTQQGQKSLPDTLEQLERQMIHDALRQNRWNKTRTAQVLGISRRNLIRKVEKYGFDRRSG